MARLTSPMDRRRSWKREFPTSLRLHEANIVVQTNGGLLEGDCAAAAFVIGLWGHTAAGEIYEPLIIQGTYLHLPCTVLLAQQPLIALAVTTFSSVKKSLVDELFHLRTIQERPECDH